MTAEFKPYYVVIFTSVRTQADPEYDKMDEETFVAVGQMAGYLGSDSYRDENGKGVTIARFESEEAIRAWRNHGLHLEAQDLGRKKWFSHYNVRVCKVEREYEFNK